MRALLAIFFVFTVALGEEIKAFDWLGRDNVTIQARHKSGGSSADYSYKDFVG